ncbi:MAG TPA: GNAT family N-acetyltransferase [Prolixibacteraceae bacterium]|nr:GNAT family N-acetyltransferase [Prolixibacteraceae bacterium]
MEIKQINERGKGSFKAYKDGLEAGKLAYSWSGKDKIIIDHTEVDPEFEGKGIGKQLVMEAVDFARQNNLKIIPLCSFSKSVFDRTKEIGDVLFKSES